MDIKKVSKAEQVIPLENIAKQKNPEEKQKIKRSPQSKGWNN